MDDYLFQEYLDGCTNIVQETTTCFEAFVFEDPNENLVKDEREIALDDVEHLFNDFGQRPEGCLGGIRLILQRAVKHSDTFESHSLSLPKKQYESMVKSMKLPLSWIETSSCVGPVFWSGIILINGKQYLQIIYRKSDVKKADIRKSRNWELALSHEMETGITRGFFKGTERSDIAKCVACLRSCPDQIDHPLFLPILIFSYDMEVEKRHRDNRERVRVLEKEVAEAAQKYNDRDITRSDSVDLAKMNNELVQCHKEVLWKRPEGYLGILQTIDNTLVDLRAEWPESQRARREAVDPLLASRLKLLKAKLEGIRTHRHITISRLKLVGNVLRNLVSLSIFRQQKEIKFEKLTRQRTLSMEISNEEERRDTQQAQKEMDIMLETRKQTTMAIIGIIFLPGAFVSSIFSTTFFDFQSGDAAGVISKKFWVYWALTVPITLTLLVVWLVWHHRTKALMRKKVREIQELKEENSRKVAAIMRQPLPSLAFELQNGMR